MLSQELFVLDPEKEGLQDEGHHYGHDYHGDDVEGHEEDAAPFVGHDSMALHDQKPVVDNYSTSNDLISSRFVAHSYFHSWPLDLPVSSNKVTPAAGRLSKLLR